MNLPSRLLMVATLMVSGFASAQAVFPSRPIVMIVPQAAGGTNDIVGRLVSQKLGEVMGVAAVVENRPGAGGNIGTQAAAKAAKDGYTLLMTISSSQAINPALYKSPGFDPVKDFKPISLIGAVPNVLLVNPAFPAKSVAELLALAKAKTRRVSVCVRRQWHAEPPVGRDAQQHGEHQPAACALQGCGPGHQ